MRVFITGAAGYIGNAVARAFRNAGHIVTGLVRNENAAKLLRQQEIEPLVGDIAHLELYAHAAEKASVLVNCAFENSKEGVAKDAKVMEALIGFAKSMPKTVLYTSGVWVYGATGPEDVDESSPLNPIDLVKWRPKHEEILLSAASTSLKPIVIRAGIVFGGNGGLTSLWFEGSQKGAIPQYGEGNNHLPMIHVEDLARLYVMAAEKELGPIVFNAVNQQHPTEKECVEAIASYLQLPVVPYSAKEASVSLGILSQGFALNQNVSAERACRLLGWHARYPGFIEDISSYFEAWQAIT